MLSWSRRATAGWLLAAVIAACTPASAQQTPAPPAAQPATAKPEGMLAWVGQQWQSLVGLFQHTRPGAGTQSGTGAGAGGPPPTVTVSRPAVRSIVEWDEYTGRFEAVESVEIRARVSGYLVNTHFRDGQMVKKGDLLFTIDPRPFERALEQAQAEHEQWNTRIANASKDVDRARPLLRQRILSEKTFDDRENTFEDARAAAKVAEAKVKTAELDLSFTRIMAPIDGRISKSGLSNGNYVIGNNASSTLLTTIVSQDPVQLYFDVNENSLIKYKRLTQGGQKAGAIADGGTAEVALADEKGFPHRGKLDFSDNRLDPSTGTLRVRAVVDNRSALFSPGMFARVRVMGTNPHDAVMVPDSAIGIDQAAKFVYVVAEDGTASRRVVQPGPLVDGLRVVREGLTGDDWVVVNGMQRVRPGNKVNPKREPIKTSDGPGGQSGQRPAVAP